MDKRIITNEQLAYFIKNRPYDSNFNDIAQAALDARAENATLAEQLRQMREALDSADGVPYYNYDEAECRWCESADKCNPTCTKRKIAVALALTPTSAEATARENAEKAALLDKLDLFSGAVYDGLIMNREAALARKQANGESTSDERAERCEKMMRDIAAYCETVALRAANAAKEGGRDASK